MPGTNTQTLTGIFGDIADEIRAKDGSSATITPANMASAIAAIPSGGGFDWSQVKGGISFKNATNQPSLDLREIDTSTFTVMNNMFHSCSSLTSLDLSSFNTGSVTNMSGLFYGCSRLTSLDLSSFNTGSVTNMENMFAICSGLTSLDLSSFNTGSVTNMERMFDNCWGLTSLDLSSFNTGSVANMNNMFFSCSRLTSLDLSSFNTGSTYNMGYMINGCSALTDMIWAIDSTTVQPLKTANGWDKSSGTVPTDLNIWVRDSLLTSYQTETNCARYSACFQPISDLPAALQTLYNIDPSDYQ